MKTLFLRHKRLVEESCYYTPPNPNGQATMANSSPVVIASNQTAVATTKTVSTPNKTQGISILALQSVAASTVLISSAQDVSTKWGATLFIRFGRRSATASTIGGVNIRVEASYKASLDNSWIPLAIFTTGFAACEAQAITAAAINQKVLSVASTANLAAGDIIFIDNGTIGLSEWARIKSIVTDTSVTIEDDLITAQASTTLYDSAELFICQLDLSSIGRIRVVDDGSVFTQAHAIQVDMITFDSAV